MKGTWDSIHVIEVTPDPKQGQGMYRLTSTVMLFIETQTPETGRITLAGSLTRQDAKNLKINRDWNHVANIGKMIEDMEFKLRQTIETIYFGKTKDIVNNLRTTAGMAQLSHQNALQAQIKQSVGQK